MTEQEIARRSSMLVSLVLVAVRGEDGRSAWSGQCQSMWTQTQGWRGRSLTISTTPPPSSPSCDPSGDYSEHGITRHLTKLTNHTTGIYDRSDSNLTNCHSSIPSPRLISRSGRPRRCGPSRIRRLVPSVTTEARRVKEQES